MPMCQIHCICYSKHATIGYTCLLLSLSDSDGGCTISVQCRAVPPWVRRTPTPSGPKHTSRYLYPATPCAAQLSSFLILRSGNRGVKILRHTSGSSRSISRVTLPLQLRTLASSVMTQWHRTSSVSSVVLYSTQLELSIFSGNLCW